MIERIRMASILKETKKHKILEQNEKANNLLLTADESSKMNGKKTKANKAKITNENANDESTPTTAIADGEEEADHRINESEAKSGCKRKRREKIPYSKSSYEHVSPSKTISNQLAKSKATPQPIITKIAR